MVQDEITIYIPRIPTVLKTGTFNEYYTTIEDLEAHYSKLSFCTPNLSFPPSFPPSEWGFSMWTIIEAERFIVQTSIQPVLFYSVYVYLEASPLDWVGLHINKHS